MRCGPTTSLDTSSVTNGLSMLPDLMHATQVARPIHTKGWVYEEKYDGWRMLALKWLKVKQRDYRVEERGWDSRNKS